LAGFAFSVPVHLRNLKRGMVSFVAEGPVTNLLLAVIVAGLFLALTLLVPSREAVRAFLGSSVSLGLFVFLFQDGIHILGLGRRHSCAATQRWLFHRRGTPAHAAARQSQGGALVRYVGTVCRIGGWAAPARLESGADRSGHPARRWLPG